MRGKAILLAGLLLSSAAGADGIVNGGSGGSVTGSFTAGDLLVANSSGQVVDLATASVGLAPKGLQFTGNIVYSGTNDQTTSWLWQGGNTLSGTISGTPSDGQISPIHFFVSSDTVDTGAATLSYFSIDHRSQAGLTGNRAALQTFENVLGAPASGAVNYVSHVALTRGASNLGGSTGAYTNYSGSLFGSNPNVFTASGATFLTGIFGQELDVTLVTGSSAAEKHGLTIVQGASDAVRAAFDDNALQISAQDGTSTTWLTGIMFGAYAHKWSFGADSTLIGAQVRTVGTASSSIALNGVDFSAVTFQSGGCSFKSTGHCIDPSGNNQSLTFQLGSTTSSPTGNEIYLSASNTLSVSINGSLASSWSPNAFLFTTILNGTATYGIRNTQSLSNSAMQIQLGNNTSASEVTMTVNSSANVAGNGANSFTVNAVAGLWLQGNGNTGIAINTSGGVQIGAATPLTLALGEVGLPKITASGSAPGAAGLKFEAVCGTNAGTAKIITYAGTSTTPVTVVDNVGSGVSGC